MRSMIAVMSSTCNNIEHLTLNIIYYPISFIDVTAPPSTQISFKRFRASLPFKRGTLHYPDKPIDFL